MFIKMTNVGAIKEAAVDLTGLSVIAGKNGTGKSTIGKTVYTIIKSIQEQGNIVEKKKREFIDWVCKNIYFTLQAMISRAENSGVSSKEDNDLLESHFQLGAFESPLFQYMDNNDFENASILVASRMEMVDKFSNIIDEDTKQKTKEFLRTIANKLVPMDTKTSLKESLVTMYQNVFEGQINNLKSHLTSEVDFGNLLKYSVSNNADTVAFYDRFQIQFVDENISEKVFQDATFVETPLLLQMEKVRDTNHLPTYWRDLLSKVSEKTSLQNDAIRDAISGISEALGGKLEYNTNKRRFEFIKKDFNEGANVSVNNVASGEKVLGIFQQLALNNMFGADKITILDEPENHLHPEWLVILAEVLVKLAIAKCPILITSHSPDFLQALRFYAKKYGLTQTKFYLANSETKTIEDKTGKEYEIFDNLAKPINDIFSFSMSEALS